MTIIEDEDDDNTYDPYSLTLESTFPPTWMGIKISDTFREEQKLKEDKTDNENETSPQIICQRKSKNQMSPDSW